MTLVLDVQRLNGHHLGKTEYTAEVPSTPAALSALCKALLAPSQGGESPSFLKLCVPAFIPLSSELAVGQLATASYSHDKHMSLPAQHAQPESEDDSDDAEDGEDGEAAVPKCRPSTPLRADGKPLPNLHYCDIALSLKAVTNADGCVP